MSPIRPNRIEGVEVEEDVVAVCVGVRCGQVCYIKGNEIVRRLFEEVFVSRLSPTRTRTFVRCGHELVALKVRLISDSILRCIEVLNRAVIRKLIIVLKLYELRVLKIARCLFLEIAEPERRELDQLSVQLLLRRRVVSHQRKVVHCCELNVLKLCKVGDVEHCAAVDPDLGLGVASLKVDTVGVKEALRAPVLKVTEFGPF